MEIVKRSVVAMDVSREVSRLITEDFRAVMDTCHNILSKTMERLTPKSEPLSKLLALGDYAVSVQVYPW